MKIRVKMEIEITPGTCGPIGLISATERLKEKIEESRSNQEKAYLAVTRINSVEEITEAKR